MGLWKLLTGGYEQEAQQLHERMQQRRHHMRAIRQRFITAKQITPHAQPEQHNIDVYADRIRTRHQRAQNLEDGRRLEALDAMRKPYVGSYNPLLQQLIKPQNNSVPLEMRLKLAKNALRAPDISIHPDDARQAQRILNKNPHYRRQQRKRTPLGQALAELDNLISQGLTQKVSEHYSCQVYAPQKPQRIAVNYF